jgi:hypothetical protein
MKVQKEFYLNRLNCSTYDPILRSSFNQEALITFYTSLPVSQFSELRKLPRNFVSVFDSTYTFEQSFQVSAIFIVMFSSVFVAVEIFECTGCRSTLYRSMWPACLNDPELQDRLNPRCRSEHNENRSIRFKFRGAHTDMQINPLFFRKLLNNSGRPC